MAKPTKDVFPFFNKPLFIFHEFGKLLEQVTSLQRDPTASELELHHLNYLHKRLAKLILDPYLQTLVKELQFFQSTFEKLCKLLEQKRFDTAEKVKSRVQVFVEHLKPYDLIYPALRKVERRIQKYWDVLFTAYDVPGLPRLNNSIEHFNLALKQIPRRQCGRRDNWLFIEHYGAHAAFLGNFLPGKDAAQSIPLERCGIDVKAELVHTFYNISKYKLKTILDEIKEKFQNHRFILKILHEGVNWIFQEPPELPLKIS